MALLDQVPDLSVSEGPFIFPTAMSSNINQHPDQHPVSHQNRSDTVSPGFQPRHRPWNTCVAHEGNLDLPISSACCFRGYTYYRLPPQDNTERERRDREIEDVREDIGWLQKRITEINIALDETRKTTRVLREATQRNMAPDETRQTIKALAETAQFHNQQVSQARADNELLHQRNQELRRLIRDARQRQ